MLFSSLNRFQILSVIGLSGCLALLVSAPVLVFPFVLGDAYRGINIAHFGNDEHHYLSRAKEVLEGHALGQMYLAEGKDMPDSFASNIEQVMFTPMRIIGIPGIMNVVTLINILNFLGVWAVLLLLYALAYAMSRDHLLSLASALFPVGGYTLLQNNTVLYTMFHDHRIFYDGFNIYGRSMFPYAAQVPFFGFLIASYFAAKSEYKLPMHLHWKSYVSALIAGLLFGSLFYVYFYAWTFAFAIVGALFVAGLLWRRWTVAITAVMVGAIGLSIGSFKLIELYKLYTSPLGHQFSYFFMTIHDRAFIASSTSLAISLLFAAYFFLHRKDDNNFFIFAVILAGWVALEQQIITGMTVQYGHYYWYFVAPLSILVGAYLFIHLLPYSRLRGWSCVALIAIAFMNTIGVQYRSFPTTLQAKLREQDFAPILEALRKMPAGIVFGDPGGQSYPLLVTIYTDHDTYWVPAAITSAFSPDHLREALFTYLYVNREARRNPVAYLKQNLASSTPNAYTEMYEELEGFESQVPLRLYRRDAPHTDSAILTAREVFLPQFGTSYDNFIHTSGSVRAALVKERVRYVLWDKRQYPEWDLSPLEPLTEIATSTDLILYSLSTTQ